MTVRTITGTYLIGYSLSPAYTGLVIASSAKVYGQGVYVSFTASIPNFGEVSTSGHYAHGVYLKNGGAVTNGSTAATGATITGYYDGVVVKGAAASIANFGTISSTSPKGGGIYLGAGGSVTNGRAADTLATIRGGYDGVAVVGGPATVTNFGMIQGGTVSGVDLRAGGSVINGSAADTGATIVASEGVAVAGGAATIANFGTISGLGGAMGLGVGVGLGAGGTVTNGSATDTAATIGGKDIGVLFVAGPATVINLGTITRSNALATGIQLSGVGNVTNGSTADTVAQIVGGVSDKYAPATIANYGTISGGPGGVVLGPGGTVTNGSAADTTATISGDHAGVYVKGSGATVTNFGAIVGTGGPAVEFVSAGDTLVAEAGCVFTGQVLGGGGTLDLDSGTGIFSGNLAGGTVSVSGSMASTAFSNFGTVEIGAAATFASSGAVTLAAGQAVIDAGSVTLGTKKASVTSAGLIETTGAGALTIVGKLANTGTLSANGGTLTVTAAVTGGGVATISGGALDFASGFNETVAFTGKTGVLKLAQSQTYTATITGFSKSGRTSLDLADIGFVSSSEATYSGTKKSGVLTVTDGTHTAQINLKGNYLSSTFVAASDGHGGTIVVDPTATNAGAPPVIQPAVHKFIAAMAGLGGVGGGSIQANQVSPTRELMLAAPRAMIA